MKVKVTRVSAQANRFGTYAYHVAAGTDLGTVDGITTLDDGTKVLFSRTRTGSLNTETEVDVIERKEMKPNAEGKSEATGRIFLNIVDPNADKDGQQVYNASRKAGVDAQVTAAKISALLRYLPKNAASFTVDGITINTSAPATEAVKAPALEKIEEPE